MALNFGKHRGKDLKDIPLDYIEWGMNNLDNDWSRQFKDEFQRRQAPKSGYTIVLNQEDRNNLTRHIESYNKLAFDIETTGLNTRKDTTIGFSVTGKAGVGFYLPRYTYNNKKDSLEPTNNEDVFLNYLEMLKNKKLITWNGSFDTRFILNEFGLNLINSIYIDAQLLKHTLEEEGFFSLKEVAVSIQKYIGFNAEKQANQEQIELKENIEKNGGSTTKANYEMYKADLDILGKYAAADADLTLRVASYYREKLKKENLEGFFFKDEVMPLYREVTIPMENKGVKLDMELLKSSKKEIEGDINSLEKKVVDSLFETEEAYQWYSEKVESFTDEVPRGKYAQGIAEYFDLNLPKTKAGKFSVSKGNVEQLEDCVAKQFLLGETQSLDLEDQFNIKETVYLEKNDLKKVNISSKKQMGEIVFNFMGIKPLSKTEKGNPQFNDDMIDFLAKDGFEWAKLLHDYNKLIKIRSSYIDRFLDNNENGYYFFSYKQFGTLSGRYGSDAQQLPRTLEEGQESDLVRGYVNRVRAFFISEEGRSFIDCDYESLEPHVFAHVSGDEGLRDIFRKGHDFYSTIAIATEGLYEYSADKKADNYLGKLDKSLRQKAKAYCLGVPYGMGPYALGKTLEISTEEAEELVDNYLNAYPKLKKWMDQSKKDAQVLGYVKSEAGRIRHLPKAKKLYSIYKEKLMDFRFRQKLLKSMSKDEILTIYRDYKNSINNSRNFQIQSMSASIVNKAAIAINRWFKENNIDGWVCGQIHDQLIFNVPNKYLEECKKNIQHFMENTTKLSLDLKAPPEIAKNWRDAH